MIGSNRPTIICVILMWGSLLLGLIAYLGGLFVGGDVGYYLQDVLGLVFVVGLAIATIWGIPLILAPFLAKAASQQDSAISQIEMNRAWFALLLTTAGVIALFAWIYVYMHNELG